MVTLSPLHKKLLRDLWRLRGQVLAIAVVIGSGVATLVMSLTTIEALEATTRAYYQQYRFADVFAYAKRAPNHIAQQFSSIPGVQNVQTRITYFVPLDIQGLDEPAIGQTVSIQKDSPPILNQLVLRKGQWISGEHQNEVILSEPFADAHGLDIGDQIGVVMNGHKRQFSVVGIALCPEFIYSIAPGGLIPDDKRFGILWISRDVLAAAFDLKGSFNQVTLSFYSDANHQQVADATDAILSPFGGTRAILRKDQISNWFVENELAQQRTMARILPSLFMAVAMFLTHMVLTRLIANERTEIGLLKAFGYSKYEIGWHYIKMVVAICTFGILLGSLLGAILGRLNTEMYAELFRFPLLIYRPSPTSFAIGAALSIMIALLGAATAVWQAVKLPPAEAMTPPSPPSYRHSRLLRSRLTRWFDQPTRIALRQIHRWPFRSFLTSSGIAMGIGLIIMNLQWEDSLNHLSRVYFFEAQRQDVMVGLHEPKALADLKDFGSLPGVLRAEPLRIVSANFSAGHKSYRGAINGVVPDGELFPIYDAARRTPLPVPSGGLLMSDRLAQKLGITVGDNVWTEFLEGKRVETFIPVVGLFNTYIGLPVFMELETLNRLIGESPRFQYANLVIDGSQQQTLFTQLKNTAGINAVMLRLAAFDSFNQTLIEHLMVFISMFTVLAVLLATGVTYNSARIAFSERGRELATLRVLGFSKAEISYVLLGEVMLLTLLSIPLGSLIGLGLVWSMASAFDTEMFRIPLIIEASTFGYAIVLVLVAAGISALLVRNKVNNLDLIRVLKTRE